MSISATEAKNRFGYYCSRAKTEPVIVDKDGRPDTVLIGFDAYQALKAASGARRKGASAGKAFYEQYKDWVDLQNELVEKHGIPGEEYRPW